MLCLTCDAFEALTNVLLLFGTEPEVIIVYTDGRQNTVLLHVYTFFFYIISGAFPIHFEMLL